MGEDIERRIERARQAALRQRLIGEGLLPAQADEWIESWRRVGGDPATSAFWERGYDWIHSRRAEVGDNARNGRRPAAPG